MDSVLPFLHIIERLKNLPLAGWVLKGVQGPESVSDHMGRMAIICMLLPKVWCCIWSNTNLATLTLLQDNSFDQNKCIRMALIHDIGEAIIGDITPHEGVSKSIRPN